MSVINVLRSMKIGLPSCIILVKVGNFYNAYSKDSYIISYLMGYKIQEKQNIPTCGFPVSAISKVENVLERNKVNYIIVDKKANYEEEYKYINKQENNYDNVYNNAKRNIGCIFRINRINNILMQDVGSAETNKKLDEIEKVLQND